MNRSAFFHHRTVDDIIFGPVQQILRTEFDPVKLMNSFMERPEIAGTVITHDAEVFETFRITGYDFLIEDLRKSSRGKEKNRGLRRRGLQIPQQSPAHPRSGLLLHGINPATGSSTFMRP